MWWIPSIPVASCSYFQKCQPMFFDWESNHGGTSNDITDNRSGTSVFQACIGRQSSQSVQWFSGFKTSRKKIFPLFYRPSIWFWLWHHKNQIKWVNLAEHQIRGPWGYHRLAEVWLDGHRKSFYKAWRRGADWEMRGARTAWAVRRSTGVMPTESGLQTTCFTHTSRAAKGVCLRQPSMNT